MDEEMHDFKKEENLNEEVQFTWSKDDGAEDSKTCDESMGESDNFKDDKVAMHSEFTSGDCYVWDGQQSIAIGMEQESKVTEEYLSEVESASHLGKDQPKIADDMKFAAESSIPATVNDECGDLPGNVKALSERDHSYDAPPWTFGKEEAKINDGSEGKVIVQTPVGVQQGADQFEWDFQHGEESVEEIFEKDILQEVKAEILWNFNCLVASEKKKAMQESLAEARSDDSPFEAKELQSKNEPKDTPQLIFGKQECLEKASIDSEGDAIVPTLLDEKQAASLDSSFGDHFQWKSPNKQEKESEKLKQEPIKGYEEQVSWDMQVIIERENEKEKQSNSDRPHKLEETGFRPYENTFNGNRSSNSRTEIGNNADDMDTNLKELDKGEPIYDIPRWTFGNRAGLAATNTFNKGDEIYVMMKADSCDDESAASSGSRYEDHHHGNSARDYEHGREVGKQVFPSEAETAPKHISNAAVIVSVKEKKPLGSISSTTMGKFVQTKASLNAENEPIYDVPRWTFGNRGVWNVIMDSKGKETVQALSDDEQEFSLGFRIMENPPLDNQSINGKEKVKLYSSEPDMETVYENVASMPKAASVKRLDELNGVNVENTDDDHIYEYIRYPFSSGGAIPKANPANKRGGTVPTDLHIEEDARSMEFKFEDQLEWDTSNSDKYATDKINKELCREAQHSTRQEQKRSRTTKKTQEGHKLSTLESIMEKKDYARKGAQKCTENIYDNLSFISDERKDESCVVLTEDASAAPIATADSHVEEQPQAGATRPFAAAAEAFRRLLFSQGQWKALLFYALYSIATVFSVLSCIYLLHDKVQSKNSLTILSKSMNDQILNRPKNKSYC